MKVQEMIKLKNWVVIGDVTNETKYAYRILKKFREKGYRVSGIHPKNGHEVYKDLKSVPYEIDAIDLCINPKLGLEFIKEAKELNINKVLIQPGAESKEILDYCRENDIVAIEDCALVQLSY